MGIPGAEGLPYGFDKPCYLWKLEMHEGYCSRTGAYFGTPHTVYCAANYEGVRHFCRARSRAEAKANFENRYPHICWVRG